VEVPTDKEGGESEVLWKLKLNTVNMLAWVHKECDIMDEDALLRL
jgi:hypothetical protein